MLSFTDAVVHVLLVAFSSLVLMISLFSYADRRTSRYFFLSLAFAFLALSQAVGLTETVLLSNQLVLIPLTGIHLSHFLDFLMLASFSLALLVKSEKRLGNGEQQ